MLFSKDVIFTSNVCFHAVISISSKSSYITVMEYTNITFKNNTYSNKILVFQPFDYGNPYPFSGFQYITLALNHATTALANHYSITFSDNNFKKVGFPPFKCESQLYHLTTHCQWIPSSVFYGYNPGVINQQIIQTDQHQPSHHTTICYCSHDITNCSVDVLGPVYPVQVLQVELCVPNGGEHAILYAETYSKLLPTSACRIAQEAQLLYSIVNYSQALNFTIAMETQTICELFLTVSPCLYTLYEVFYVQILPCPVGFTLQNGVCDCDPYLSNSNIHIDTCYIDQSTITRPANTWITAYSYSNNTKYLISHNCPMDYCLPHNHTHHILTYLILIYSVSLTGLVSCVHSVHIHLVWYLDHQGVYTVLIYIFSSLS